jgi:hypothetical protein
LFISEQLRHNVQCRAEHCSPVSSQPTRLASAVRRARISRRAKLLLTHPKHSSASSRYCFADTMTPRYGVTGSTVRQRDMLVTALVKQLSPSRSTALRSGIAARAAHRSTGPNRDLNVSSGCLACKRLESPVLSFDRAGLPNNGPRGLKGLKHGPRPPQHYRLFCLRSRPLRRYASQQATAKPNAQTPAGIGGDHRGQQHPHRPLK